VNATRIALNRFGLGRRAGEPWPDKPAAWLLDQLDRFAPRPDAIAAIPGSTAALIELREFETQRKALRQDAAATQAMAPAANMAAASPVPSNAGPSNAGPAKPGAGLLAPIRRHYVDAVGARTATAITSPTPFAERLVQFWSNHFAVSIDKGRIEGLAGPFEFEAIRPNLMGTFGEMLLAVERHPAMLLYLDQAQSIGPDSVLGQRAAARAAAGGGSAAARKVGLNENLAREILELHTLGVRSGYDQQDVTEFARALTGWTVAGLGAGYGPRQQEAAPGYLFADVLHQPGARQIVGRRYEAGGEAQGRAILADLATHPATARHIATKLARHFTADDPPPALVARLEKSFLATGGKLPALYRVLVESPEPWAAGGGAGQGAYGQARFRTPWDWTIATLRATAAPIPAPQALNNLFNQLGQPVWKPGSPAGYDDIDASWAGPDSLVRRVEAAGRLASRTGQPAASAPDAPQLATFLFGDDVSPATKTALARAESQGQALAMLLVSPEMLRR
jgi:uncharacterized protein (DUF1800 family)